MKVGYARVSTREQNLDLQIDALRKSGCTKVYEETVSGAKTERHKLKQMLEELRADDVVVIWKLDRLGRSLPHLVEIVQHIMKMGAGLQSLNDPIDTTTAQGRLVFNIFASLAEFERDLIKQRTYAGLEAARSRGRMGGRPKGLPNKAHATACAAEILYKEGKLGVAQIAEQLSISKNTLYNYLRHRNVPIGSYKGKSDAKTLKNPQ